jgi:ESCRT-I complex subunit VPS37
VAGAAKEVDEESDNLHDDFLRGKLELAEFMPKYKQLRIVYHKRQLMRLAAMTSPT